jgi:hypothetical protein
MTITESLDNTTNTNTLTNTTNNTNSITSGTVSNNLNYMPYLYCGIALFAFYLIIKK